MAQRQWLLCCLLLAAPFGWAAGDVPPTEVFAVDLGASGASNVVASRHVIDHQSDTVADFSFIERRPLGGGPFYFSGGVRGESFNVQNAHDFPIEQLQDYGAQLSVEYYVGDVRAAYLTLRPGFYFETHPTMASWDVPVEFATGIPITSAFNGVAGVSYGRFWHHPVPIAGFSWTINPAWRLDAIYPNPTLAYTISKNLEAQLAGELFGNGFRTDADPGRSVVEYHVYRVGANLAWQMRPGFKITSGAGLEYERVFDFWRAGESFRATGAPYLRLGIELSR
jgi:hypothetical protein